MDDTACRVHGVVVDCHEYTLVPWSWLSNMSSIAAAQPMLFRWNMSDAWLSTELGIRSNETFFVKDSTPYQFRFVDADPLDMPGARYQEIVSTTLLGQLPHRLVHLGTLFGSSRLRLRRRRLLLFLLLLLARGGGNEGARGRRGR